MREMPFVALVVSRAADLGFAAVCVGVLATVVTGLLGGTFFGLWWGVTRSDRRYDFATYVRTHQETDKTFGRQMPYLFVLTLLLDSLFAWWMRGSAAGLFAAVAVLCVGGMMASTLTFNVPINRAINSWSPDAPQPDWERLRDRWLRFQAVRTFLGVVALGCTATAAVLA